MNQHDKIHRLTVHFYALAEMLDKKNPVTAEEFALQYPRTWNAVMTQKPLSFDLPSDAGPNFTQTKENER